MSREVDRVATRKSLVFILRMNPDGLLCTSCVQYVRLAKLSSLFLAVHNSRAPITFFRELVGYSGQGMPSDSFFAEKGGAILKLVVLSPEELPSIPWYCWPNLT
jgi:hypothetical protein